EVVRSVRIVLDQWKNAQSRKGGALLVDVINNVSEVWRKPMLNTVKVNVDRAIFEAQNKFGFGCVGRDSNGRLLTTFFASRVGLVKPEIAETIGIKKVLSWIKKKQWANVIIEIDALLVVQAIKSSILMHAFPV
uniref:RNase H type-1 domain-containing protein n=1 Tax=Cannabis sativa TaxID=3483 RepID=A0A803QRH0_CANSA